MTIVCARCKGSGLIEATLTERQGIHIVRTWTRIIECACVQYNPLRILPRH